jgi:Leucine-rich repeat (LRR) protein
MFKIEIFIVFFAGIFITKTYAALPIAIEDIALRTCIEQLMEKEGVSLPEQLTNLKCHHKSIKSVSGIEQFANLESLSLFGNSIAKADLTSLKSLKHLNLAKNQLTNIQINGLKHLETLYLFKNKLSTINFDGVLSLIKMRIMQNELNQLDISPLQSLTEAYLWDNQLEDLQIKGLQNLEFLDVKQNPMPDELYDFYDQQSGITISHDGNADDWK